MDACLSSAVASGNLVQGSSTRVPVGEGRVRKERSDCRVTDAGLYDAIVAHFGILTYVAIAVGISRAALYKRVDRAPQLQAARDGARRVVVEVATYHLRKALSEGADWAVHFYMCRQDGIWFSMTEPREPKGPSESREPREPKAEEPEESEPQPERANKTMLRLIRAVERGEPWAVKYCLNHLEPNGRYAKKSHGPEAVIARPEMAEQPEPRGFDQLSPLAERAAELADAYFDSVMGKGPNPFETADHDVTRPTAPTDIRASEPGCVSTRTGGIIEDIGQQATGPRADATRLACGSFEDDAGLTALPESAPTLELVGGPSVTGAATGTGAPTVAGAPTHTRKPKPVPTLKGRRANAHDRTRKRRVRIPSRKRSARRASSPSG